MLCFAFNCVLSNMLVLKLHSGSECLDDLNPREYQPYICQAPIKVRTSLYSGLFLAKVLFQWLIIAVCVFRFSTLL